ncbi:MAG: DUF2079 domain-containing protein [Planctomycetales bacterium]|nr:DUF2079 domain-containing protein [Planctomycetales bacterium]
MGRTRSKLVAAIWSAVCGSVLMSGMVWTVLTEPRLSAGFWPRDIGKVVVQACGGTTDFRFAADPQIELSWLSVVVRLAALLILGATVSVSWTQLRATPHAARRKSQRIVTVFLSTIVAISRPWWFAGFWIVAWLLATSTSNPAFLNFLQFTTPLLAALLWALSLNGFCNSMAVAGPATAVSQNGAGNATRGRKELLVVLLAAVCWEATSFWMNERLYAGLLVPHGDSAMYEEHLWNVWHGKGFRSYLDQGLFLGEHIQVIHLFLLPLHRIWPSYLMLELVASCSLAICVIPIFSITKRHSGSSCAAMWLSLAWLLYFPLHFLDIAIDLKTLRPSCYGLPFLFWAIDFAERRRLISSSVCFLIALTTQEDFALVVGSIGAVFFLIARQNSTGLPSGEAKRVACWSIGLLVFSVAWVLLAVLVVIPAFRGGEVVHYSRYFGDLGHSPGDLLRTALHAPGKIVTQLVSLRTLFYVLVLTVPLGLKPLRRPLYLLAGAATFGMLSLIQLGNSSATTEMSGLAELPPIPFHHFHAPLLPVLFWAAAASLGSNNGIRRGVGQRQPNGTWFRFVVPPLGGIAAGVANKFRLKPGLQTRRNAVSAARLAFFCAAFTGISGSLMPLGATFWSHKSQFGWRNLYVPGERAAELQKVLAMLPTDARVASTDYVHTRLTHFERSYDYSGYLRAVNNDKPGVPADTDYIVIDTGHRYSEIKSIDQVRELKENPEQWEVVPVETQGLFIVLKRRSVIGQ